MKLWKTFTTLLPPHLFKQFKVDDLLFVEYNCIIEETQFGFWSHNNCFVYMLTGRIQWRTLDSEYFLRRESPSL